MEAAVPGAAGRGKPRTDWQAEAARLRNGAAGRSSDTGGVNDPLRGRHAEAPRQIPARGWKDILWRVKGQIKQDHLSIISAGVAFYAFLAIFPGLIALVTLYGLIADPAQIESQLGSLGSILPPEAADMIMGQLHDLVQADEQTLGMSALGAVALALWSASSGVRTLMEALNVAYNEDERRGFFSYYGTALLLTLGAVLGALTAMAVVVAVPAVLKFVGLGTALEGLIAYARWPIIAGGMLIGLAVMYRYGPSRNKPRWAWVSPGAIVATLLWLLASALFSFYVTRFGNYNETYGAIGAVVILMLWFYITAYVCLIGAEVNSEIERQTVKDTTEGRPEPLGRRDAYSADTVGESA